MAEFLEHKRILFFSHETIPYNSGSGRNAFYFARYLADKGFQAKLISLNRNQHLPFRTIANKLIISRIPYFNRNKLFKWLSLFLILPFYLYEILKTNIILIYGPMPAYEFIIICGKLFRKKIIFRSLLFGEDDLQSILEKKLKIFQFIYILLFNWIDLYFSKNNEFTKSYFSFVKNKNNIFESPQGVDTGIFYPLIDERKKILRNKLSLQKDIFIILSVGYLIKRKGFDTTFKNLAQLDIPFLYIVIGDYNLPSNHYFYKSNNEMMELYDLGKSLLGNKILFTGPKDNIFEYLQVSDILLINSKQEGYPTNILLEAMSCKLPALIKKLPGIYTFVDLHNKNALMFNFEDEMVDYIKKLFYNADLRKTISENAYHFIIEHASFKKVAEKMFVKLYKNREYSIIQ